ncbi:uncharacterized protein LOC115216564 [Octopus sinensis]|uniref:Uncharacterized protein LOC115216564 n=1 Tax=Octopus sinensis TaxID=2607531 RepID=A0A6P7SUH4_9MOLL|nr:uncharacterized protein LOC115216564 [Octopus sinensis]
MVMVNRRVIIVKVALTLQISHDSAYQNIHEDLGFHKVCERCVPRELTAEHKRKRLDVCQHLLNRYNNEGEEFGGRIVTEHETWVHHYEAESIRQSIEGKHPGSPAMKKFKTVFCGKGHANPFYFILKKVYTGILPGKQVYDQQCKI